MAAAELARRVGVTRQTIHAIEAGSYVPHTLVALKLARELEVSVEELFSLEADTPPAPKPLHAEMLSTSPPVKGQPVRICAIGDRILSVPVNPSPYFLHEADGVILKTGRASGKADLAVYSPGQPVGSRLLVAGCDPAIGLVAGILAQSSGVDIVPAPAASRLALRWLIEGKIHVAGTHLRDAETGEFNVPVVRREYPDQDLAIVTFARWEEGFVVAAGNPQNIRKVADLARKGIRFVNRETGSGSRALLDKLLAQDGIPSTRLTGYKRVAHGHLAAAYEVSAGQSDCCIATHSAARAFGLSFVPLQQERYDFVIRRSAMELPPVQGLLDVLQKSSLRRKLEVVAGYDTRQTGALLV
jgi:molybdate-binding protein/DNA-binding XRE family transcriptional regulator